MKPCKNCGKDIDDRYIFCSECVQKYKEGKKNGVGSWHDDPLIDALLKINSNLGNIAQTLRSIEEAIDDNTDAQRGRKHEED